MNKQFLIFLLLIFLFSGCKDEKKKLLVDLSKVEKPTIKINRYEEDLFELDLVNLAEGLERLKGDYKFFLGDNPTDTLSLVQMQGYMSDPLVQDIYQDVVETYPKLEFLESELSKAFHYYRYYFPKAKIPEVYTYISGLDYEAPVKYVEDSLLIIALDMYLGEKYNYYPKVGIPQYKTQGFIKENIVVDCMKAIARSKLYDVSQNQTLIDYMVYEGKLLFFTDAMLPEVNDSLKIVYNPKQMEWSRQNESKVWSYLIDQDLLYTNDLFKINKMIGDAPFTAVFGNNSAPRIANWIGWQIVRKYMFKQEDMQLEKLFSPKLDGQTLLNKSKYKPHK